MDPGNLRGDRWVKWKGMILLGTGARQLAISLQFCVTDSPLITVKTLFVCSTTALYLSPLKVLSNPLSFIWFNYGRARAKYTSVWKRAFRQLPALLYRLSVHFYEFMLKVLTSLSGMEDNHGPFFFCWFLFRVDTFLSAANDFPSHFLLISLLPLLPSNVYHLHSLRFARRVSNSEWRILMFTRTANVEWWVGLQ